MTISKMKKIVPEDVGPDLFVAAIKNDVNQFKAAIAGGQSLNEQRPNLLNMTPLHLACVYNSNAVLELAVSKDELNPWIRDDNLRVAFDHAEARANHPAMDMLFRRMYPDSPRIA